MPRPGIRAPPFRIIYDDQIFAAQSRVIRKIAETESAVIVGRAGYHVLRGYPRTLHVFLHAPKEVRHRRVRDLYNIPDSREAFDMLEESDRNRQKFNEKVSGRRWMDPLNFHLSIDTERAGLALATQMIVQMARRLDGEPEEQLP